MNVCSIVRNASLKQTKKCACLKHKTYTKHTCHATIIHIDIMMTHCFHLLNDQLFGLSYNTSYFGEWEERVPRSSIADKLVRYQWTVITQTSFPLHVQQYLYTKMTLLLRGHMMILHDVKALCDRRTTSGRLVGAGLAT